MQKEVSTEKKIEEGNRLIMFFDGAENVVIDIMDKPEKAIKYKDGYYPGWNLPKFHKDWNLLMSIVEKIEKDCFATTSIRHKGCIIHCNDDTRTAIARFGEPKIRMVWECVVEYIEWVKNGHEYLLQKQPSE